MSAEQRIGARRGALIATPNNAGGGSTSPGGVDGNVQYNNGGAFGGFGTFNDLTNALALPGLVDLSAAAAGQIKFPAVENPSADANTLTDYEWGNWTPADASGAGLALVNNTQARYIKIGKLFIAAFDISYPVTADASNTVIGGLPFAFPATLGWGGVVARCSETTCQQIQGVGSSTTFKLFNNAGADITNATMSGDLLRGFIVGMIT